MTYGQESTHHLFIYLSHTVELADCLSVWVFFHRHCCTEKFSTSFWILKGSCGFPCGITEEPQRIHINSLIRLLPTVSKNPTSIHKTIQNIIQNFEMKVHVAWCLAHEQPLIIISWTDIMNCILITLEDTRGTLSFTIFEVDGGQKAARLPELRVKLIKVGRSVEWRGAQGQSSTSKEVSRLKSHGRMKTTVRRILGTLPLRRTTAWYKGM